ncbi:hypothetical protein SAMN04488029_0769 [Reichenbachiella faecimaris]|uniref:DUF6265 domain-containing protein n=1 Tax=Reichenbachiella faecimaris TaxID=692418 RepID=A0A1W2G7E5_REIFA|nr:DUF6265 family protein [Reichenbachiella faecimaris]SMD32424.1 hypothetical protein SAMN04488029_0769 [Reichenbachiella faecimaris]
MKNLLIPFLFVLCLQANAQENKPTIDDLNFLRGYWVGDGFGGVSEEVWMPASLGRMNGIYKHMKDDQTTFMEFMDIFTVNDTIRLRLKHFNPDMTGWEEKDKYVTFTLQSVEPNKAIFKGLIYELVDPNYLKVSLKLKQKDGSVNTEVFNFRRKTL